MRESIGNLHGRDATWARAMISRLETRGCSALEVNSAVAFVEDRCARVRRDPEAEFGDPVAFADQLRFPLQPQRHWLLIPQAGERVHLLGIGLVLTMVISTMVLAFAARDYSTGSTGTIITAGVPFIFVMIIVMVVGLLRSSAELLARRAGALILGLSAVLVGVIFVGVLWDRPVLRVARGVLLTFGVVLGVATCLGFLLTGLRCRRDGEHYLAQHLLTTGVIAVGLLTLTPLAVYLS